MSVIRVMIYADNEAIFTLNLRFLDKFGKFQEYCNKNKLLEGFNSKMEN